jgi:hypothetical protein
MPGCLQPIVQGRERARDAVDLWPPRVGNEPSYDRLRIDSLLRPALPSSIGSELEQLI